MSQDVLKNSSDNDNYNREFRNLQVQLYEMSNLTFNGVSYVCNRNSEGGDAIFNDMNQLFNRDNTMSIYVSSEGNIGPKVSINKALLLSALDPLMHNWTVKHLRMEKPVKILQVADNIQLSHQKLILGII